MRNSTVDYYTILDVPKDASADEIKKSFRTLAHLFHPDKNPGDIESEEKFKNISRAYEILGDSQKRRMYDRTGHDYYSDMFKSGCMPGGGIGCGRKRGCGGLGNQWDGSNFVIHQIAVTREEALSGITIDVGIDKDGQREVHKINLPGNIGNGTVLRYSDSNTGVDFFIKVIYSNE